MMTEEILEKMCEEKSKPRFDIIPADEKRMGHLLIEGDCVAIRNMGILLIALAEESDGEDFGFSLAPDGAGSACISKNSNYGLYINIKE
ncbi:hypothetical protein [Oricola nitratireducens]|uniref:hypothetical protein n=1 Tax=Oricola nitratireducens TaxID=2775868 RepID=UPI001866E8BB|nr:hypothetical protein [Oricola nitratireducens]